MTVEANTRKDSHSNAAATDKVYTSHVLGHYDGLLILLRHQDGAGVRVVQGVHEHLVGEHVQLLLLITGGVRGAV